MSLTTFRNHWEHPTGILSVLLLVRGDVIQKALAQLAGGPYYITPVAFSFGWVSYAVTTLLSALGEGKLMPDVDCSSIAVNAREASRRTNGSWVLGRLLRDWEMRAEYGYKDAALVVTVFQFVGNDQHQRCLLARSRGSDVERDRRRGSEQRKRQQGVPTLDRIWFAGFGVILTQCVIAVIAMCTTGSWLTLTVTVGGTILALAGGALPQWRHEKWNCRKSDPAGEHGTKSAKTVVLTRGNGHRHVIIIVDSDRLGIDLEDLAAGRVDRSQSTLPAVLILAILWVGLLLLAGNSTDNSWFLVAIGSLGMAQNVVTAAYPRHAGALGIHLGRPDFILPDPPSKDHEGKEKCNKVFQVIKKTERRMYEAYGTPRVGMSLLSIFFPAGLRPHEVQWQEEQEQKYKEADQGNNTADENKAAIAMLDDFPTNLTTSKRHLKDERRRSS